MTKYTVIGDPHLQPDNLDKAEILFNIVEDLGLPVIILGDLLHTKAVIRSEVLNFLLRRLSRSRLHFTILVGNHDWNNLECKEHALTALQGLDNVDVVHAPVIKGDVAFLPYYHDLDKFRAALKQLKKAKVLVIHQGISGFDYGTGYLAENEIDFKEIAAFPLVLSGHFHKFQEQKPLIYLGTPWSHSFGETNQIKYLGVLDTETLKVEKFETPFPQHITLEVECPYKNSAVTDIAGYVEEGHHVRVILTGLQHHIDTFPKSEFPTVKFIERADTEGTEVSLSENESNEEKFVKWAKEIKNLDDSTLKLGLAILSQAGR